MNAMTERRVRRAKQRRSPLTPSDADLRKFPSVPIDIVRLFGSEFHALANDAEWRAGITLWLKSFHQTPAGSLPDNELALCRLAELGQDIERWRSMAPAALRNWVKCSDGRLYHPVVAEKVLAALASRKRYSENGRKGNQMRWAGQAIAAQSPSDRQAIAVASPSHRNRTEEKRTEPIKPSLLLDRLAQVTGIPLERIARLYDWQSFPAHFHEWTEAGCDPERDIWPIIARKRGTLPNSPKYFRPAVYEARDARARKPMPVITTRGASFVPPDVLVDRVKAWITTGRKHWPVEWGLAPDHPDFALPPDLRALVEEAKQDAKCAP